MKSCPQIFVPALFLAITLLVFPHASSAGSEPFIATSYQKVISRIDSIATYESEFGTLVNILGNGKISNYITKTIKSPPRILIDIPCDAEPLETLKIVVASPNLTELRVGHHAQKIRLVLDLKASDFPHFSTKSINNELTIAIFAGQNSTSKKMTFEKAAGTQSSTELKGSNNIEAGRDPRSSTPFKSLEQKNLHSGKVLRTENTPKTANLENSRFNEGTQEQNIQETTLFENQGVEDATVSNNAQALNPSDQPETLKVADYRPGKNVSENEKASSVPVVQNRPATKNYTVATDTKETKYSFRIMENTQGTGLKKLYYQNTLTQAVPDDGRDDTAFMIESLNAYEAQDWSRAIENLTLLIKSNPAGRYNERASFLLAKSYEKHYSQSILEHFDELKKYYEDASYKYPASEYLPEAYLGIGNLYFQIENYYEALAYYNLTIKNAKGSSLAAKALTQKVKIMLLTERKKEAFLISSVLEDVVSRLPEMPVKTEAKILRAKILYEFNDYRKSLEILSDLLRENPDNIYQHPIISLYLGYNYYQLEDNKQAREHLLRFYNSRPDQDMNYLVLAQVGDTYRNEGRSEQAAKIYQLVLKQYPDTEGAVISKIRLAELQEEQSSAADKRIVPPFNILDEDMALATEFYKDIINNPLNKKTETPLTQLALLKLSIIYQKEKEYQKSLDHLRTLFTEYPRSKLRKEGRHALTETIAGILKKDQRKKSYTDIINFYLNEKDLVSIANDPEIFLNIGRAFLRQDFEDMGIELFKKADPLLSGNEKPPDLLFLLGQDFYKQQKLKSALERFSLLIEHYPSDNNIPYAYRLKGDILSKQKEYSQAAEMFSEALKHSVNKCERLNILIDKAKALLNGNLNVKALEATKSADTSKSTCSTIDHHLYQEIGDLYFDLGDIQKAVTVYNQAIVMALTEADKISLMLKAAQCYLRLNNKEDFLALNQKISSFNDPFWSNLAKEKMEEINFNWEMEKAKAALKKGEKI